MKLFFCLCAFICANQCAQAEPSIHILTYHVEASIDESRSEIHCTASVWIQIHTGSLRHIQFRVSSNVDIDAVRDIDGDRFSRRSLRSEKDFSTHIIELPSERQAGDSVFISIEFEETFDTSSYAAMFVNSREFLLQYSNDALWLPQFEVPYADRISLQCTVPQSLSMLNGTKPDSIIAGDGRNTWYFFGHTETLLHDFFTVCGSSTVVRMAKQSADSLAEVVFFIDTTRFHQRFADSLLAYLVNAAQYFMDLAGSTSEKFQQTYVCLGEDNIYENFVRTGAMIIERNSPAHSVFDSLLFVQSTKNQWLTALAHRFAISQSDSTALLDEGWAGFLATRYIISSFPAHERERQERLDIMLHALNFYPTNPLAAGRTLHADETEILSFKGRYIFLMLEYLLGKESFSAVIKQAYSRFSKDTITVKNFQSLCEEEYGSSLDWFFQEWMLRSTAPEYVLHWNSEQTRRGITAVRLTVEQRGDVFTMPLPVVITIGSKKIIKRIFVDQAKQDFLFTFTAAPTAVELDPDLSVLRWLLDIRILAHARSSRLFRIYKRDLSSSEREARLTLELDPLNTTGSAPIAYFSLGKIFVLKKDFDQAKEYFLKAMQSASSGDASLYPLLSLVRFGNLLEMEGKRNEALPLYHRAAKEGKKDPALFAPVIIEAEKYIRGEFAESEELWFGLY